MSTSIGQISLAETVGGERAHGWSIVDSEGDVRTVKLINDEPSPLDIDR